VTTVATQPLRASGQPIWRALLPLGIGAGIALLPVPQGLSVNAWRYFALFAAVITGVITEPVQPAVLGLAGVTLAAVLGLVRTSPAEATSWALGGFANSTVWLIFAAYMFALGYSKTGLGRRIALLLIGWMGRRTLGLGYAVTLADLVLAPFTASTTARSGGTIYPVIRSIPELYGSRPGDESARKIGAYLMYTAASTTLVTSSMFITALAPNALAVSLIAKSLNITISWIDWFKGFAPVGITLLVIVPILLYKIYPPGIKEAPEAPRWALDELRIMGPMTQREITLLVLVIGALTMWIGATRYIDPAVAAMLVVVLMVMLRVVSWDEVIGHAQAWNILVWFATLVTLASGLAETKFVDWLAQAIVPSLSGLSIYATIVGFVGAFYFLHYFFASITAHTATLFPVFLAIAVKIPGVSPLAWALLLGYSLGLMGILTPYGGAHMAVYYGSGYVKGRDFWILGLILGLVFFFVYLAIIVPWLRFLSI
jgi:L-tartrate/succinate antiporter